VVSAAASAKALQPQQWEDSRNHDERAREQAEARYAARQMELRKSRRLVRDKDARVLAERAAASHAARAKLEVCVCVCPDPLTLPHISRPVL